MYSVPVIWFPRFPGEHNNRVQDNHQLKHRVQLEHSDICSTLSFVFTTSVTLNHTTILTTTKQSLSRINPVDSNGGYDTRTTTLESHLHNGPPFQRRIPRARHRPTCSPSEGTRKGSRLRYSTVPRRCARHSQGGAGHQERDQVSTAVGRRHDRVRRPWGPCPDAAARVGRQHLHRGSEANSQVCVQCVAEFDSGGLDTRVCMSSGQEEFRVERLNRQMLGMI